MRNRVGRVVAKWRCLAVSPEGFRDRILTGHSGTVWGAAGGHWAQVRSGTHTFYWRELRSAAGEGETPKGAGGSRGRWASRGQREKDKSKFTLLLLNRKKQVIK